jgi:hypothetical protein
MHFNTITVAAKTDLFKVINSDCTYAWVGNVPGKWFVCAQVGDSKMADSATAVVFPSYFYEYNII